MLSKLTDTLWLFVCILLAIAGILLLALFIKTLIDKQNGVVKIKGFSKEKRAAMHPPVPRELLLSKKNPIGLIIGTYKGKYVALPFSKSPVHQLILGAPGTGKSTMIETALISHFNKEEIEQNEEN